MSQLRPLIKNQKLRIDNHQRGKETGWGTELHIHKTFTDGRRGGFEILVPLDHDRDVEVRKGRKTDENEFGAVKKEIAKALKAGQRRNQFVKDVSDAIHRFSRGEATLKACRDASKRIASHFGLDEEIIKEIVHQYATQLRKYQSYHIDPADKNYYAISQDRKKVAISPRKRV